MVNIQYSYIVALEGERESMKLARHMTKVLLIQIVGSVEPQQSIVSNLASGFPAQNLSPVMIKLHQTNYINKQLKVAEEVK